MYAAIKFFIFTQACGLLMLLSILALYFVHHAATGIYTFEYSDLLGTTLSPHTAFLIMLGFFLGFSVKLPMFPLHPWLPDAHTEAPTAGSVILAGLLLKTGAYGLLRFVVPLFPGASREFAHIAMTLGVIGIIYGAVMAFAQTDLILQIQSLCRIRFRIDQRTPVIRPEYVCRQLIIRRVRKTVTAGNAAAHGLPRDTVPASDVCQRELAGGAEPAARVEIRAAGRERAHAIVRESQTAAERRPGVVCVPARDIGGPNPTR